MQQKSECWKYWKSLDPIQAPSYKIGLDDFTKFYAELPPTSHQYNFDSQFMNKVETAMIDINGSDFEIPDIYDDVLNGPISSDEISRALKNIKNNKSGGCDGIAADFFKYANETLKNSLCALFNYVFDSGNYPEIWTARQIAPIHIRKTP